MSLFDQSAEGPVNRKCLPVVGAPQPASFEEQLYHAVVWRGDICFDVGANKGHVAVLLAQLAGASGLVTAFEPVWPMYCELCRAVQCDDTSRATILTVPCGLADSEKRAAVSVPNGDFGMASLAEARAWGEVQPGADMRSYEVQLTTIDAFVRATESAAPTFLKIDVEGAELLVLRGADELFNSGHRPLMLIEVFAPWERAFGYQPWTLFSGLLEQGYNFLFACPIGLVEHVPTETNPFPPEYEMGYNILVYNAVAHSKRIDALQHLRAGTAAKLLPMLPPPQPNRIL